MTVFGDEEDHILLNPKISKVNNVQFIDNGSFAPVVEYSLAEYDEPHPAYTDDWADEPMSDEEDDFLLLENGNFELTVEVPSLLQGVLIGQRGSNIKRIQDLTKCRIITPDRRACSDAVRIQGHSKENIKRAAVQIDLSLQGKRFARPATHMVTFRVNTPTLVANYENFKELAAADFDFDERLFATSTKLHLTVGVLHLLSAKDVKTAERLIAERAPQVVDEILQSYELNTVPLFEMNGLEIMNDDPYMTDVVYAKIKDPDGILQEISNSIFTEFVTNGLAEDKYNRVKVHCTLMNSKFLTDDPTRTAKDRSKSSFDSSGLLKKYEKYDFGKVKIDKVFLNERFKQSTDDYYYTVTSSVLP